MIPAEAARVSPSKKTLDSVLDHASHAVSDEGQYRLSIPLIAVRTTDPYFLDGHLYIAKDVHEHDVQHESP